ncbi:MAG: HD-GYP domain-containing protein [Sporomusaceae bacterium]|nr:HD-GYP domain-containing protein [Sporomusaceae bacterium]
MLSLTTGQPAPAMTLARSQYDQTGAPLPDVPSVPPTHYPARPGPETDLISCRAPFRPIDPDELLDQRTGAEALRFIHRGAGRFLRDRHIEIGGLKALIVKTVENAIDNRHILRHLSNLRIHHPYTFSHSLNVCLLSVLIGAKLRLPPGQLAELAVGALLHDLGKTRIPQDILDKPGPLSDTEWQAIHHHALEAFHTLRRQWALPISAAHIACQHHENYDGTGYPGGLAGDNIHLFARIVAVADNFDAVTADRPYRAAYQPHQAYEVLLWSRGSKLDPHIVDTFLDTVAVLPAGSAVLLDGDVTSRTVGKPLIDLAGELGKFIVRALSPGETKVLPAI